MSMRNSEYRGESRKKFIRQRRKLAFDLFNQDMYPHLGCYDKGKIRIWRCARDRMERLPDMREIVAIIKMEEQIYELESNINKGE